MSMNGPAVLSGALLARKGAAAPTGYTPLRPQDVNTGGTVPKNPPAVSGRTAAGAGEPPSTDGEAARMRLSVRLDRDRHLKLRLTAAHLESSLQDIMVEALDRYLEQLGPEVLRNDCACLGVNNGAADNRWPTD